MTRWLALLLTCLALVLMAAGCGGDDEEEGGGGGGANTEQPAEEDGGAAEEEGGGDAGGDATEVVMEGIQFNPTELSVSVGDTVTWVNDDSVGHDVTGDDFESGDAGAMQNGDTFEHTFDAAGSFEYVCSVHPGMDGTVTVE